jgi:hypothetical protein
VPRRQGVNKASIMQFSAVFRGMSSQRHCRSRRLSHQPLVARLYYFSSAGLRAGSLDGVAGILEELLKAPTSASWIAALHRAAPKDRELYRDPLRGFLLWRTLKKRGSTGHRMTTPALGYLFCSAWRHRDSNIHPFASRREDQARETGLHPVRSREPKVFLPADIHDTRCITGPALLFGFTGRN